MFKLLVMLPILFVMGAITVIPAMAEGDIKGNIKAGKKVFKKCKACHSLKEDDHRTGPSMHDILGREAGSIEGYDYSTAMAESGLIWDEETFSSFMKKPKELVPDTKMAFTGLKKDKDIVNLIAYIKSESEE